MNTDPNQEHGEFTLKEKFGYAALGLAVLGGSFLLGRSIVRHARSTSEQKKTFEDGNAAAFAQQLKMAFENDNAFGWGTDEEAIRNVMRKVPSKDFFRQIINSYQKLYARSLMADLKDELAATEYNEMLAILAAKPDRITGNYTPIITRQQYLAWARRLKAAFDITYWGIPGTDEGAIRAVFLEVPTQADFTRLGQVYQQEYGSELAHDLRHELEFWEYGPIMALIEKKPKA